MRDSAYELGGGGGGISGGGYSGRRAPKLKPSSARPKLKPFQKPSKKLKLPPPKTPQSIEKFIRSKSIETTRNVRELRGAIAPGPIKPRKKPSSEKPGTASNPKPKKKVGPVRKKAAEFTKLADLKARERRSPTMSELDRRGEAVEGQRDRMRLGDNKPRFKTPSKIRPSQLRKKTKKKTKKKGK
jgi:hypothetical protein